MIELCMYILFTMDSVQIIRNLQSKIKNAFYGVFPSDRLPQHVVNRPAYIVANTDPAHKSGTHWVAFYLPRRGCIEYFDSFGRRPHDKHFLNFMRNNCTNTDKKRCCFKHNMKCLQSDFSALCGHYCCVYLYNRKNKRSLNQFLSKFRGNERYVNDQIIIRMYKNIYEKKKQKQSGGQRDNNKKRTKKITQRKSESSTITENTQQIGGLCNKQNAKYEAPLICNQTCCSRF